MTTTTLTRPAPSRTVAGEIRAVMGRAGINQAELARRLGKTGHWVSTRISPTAKVDMTLEEIAEMAKGLEVSLEALLYAITDSNREPADYTETVNGSLTLASVARDAWVLAA